MSTPVIVGFDGSTAADAAVRHGAREAALRNANLHIVHAFGWFPLLPPLYPPYNASEEGPRAAVLELLAQTAHGVRREWTDLVVSTRMVDGSPGAVLVEASRGAQLIVVGHRGIGGFAGLLAGSTAMQVASHASCPITVVRGAERPENTVIVLGMDGSPHGLAAAEVAFANAERRSAELIVLHHVDASSDAQSDTVTAQVVQIARLHDDVQYRHEAAEGPSAAAALIDAANKFDAGMIVVGSRGHGGFRGLITGSTSRALVEHAGCPVTVVPPAAG